MKGKRDNKPRVVILCRSDLSGGAAVVSLRLTEALNAAGVEARMLVAEKLSDSPLVVKATGETSVKKSFLTERLKIFIANGFDRDTLFKIDTGDCGLPLWHHPLVKEADVVMLNWINQGFLSLQGVRKIMALGKPVIWTMHDLWCMTGICHHPYTCTRFHGECGDCPLLGKKASPHDLSHRIWEKKRATYDSDTENPITFVAVSNWLAAHARESKLLRDRRIEVIPNTLPQIETDFTAERTGRKKKPVILFGAARLDDPIKGFGDFIRMTEILKERYPDVAKNLEILTFGSIKDETLLGRLALPHRHSGMLHGDEAITEAYRQGDILVTTSAYETLPTMPVEAQLFGCIPVSYDSGGQPDIIDHLSTGYLAEKDSDPEKAASNLAQGVAWAVGRINSEEYPDMLMKMRRNMKERFSSGPVISKYMQLIEELLDRQQ